ncbi:dimethylargininase [Phytoactinopolyspora halotolerans]|uniref:Amidinotransferase n=1 Tax=Phytoactinopolyspora halotolerans TaxID=1981512 RepID=A0A6L9S1K7_9ACTN|nr:dimethylargininase [Phytoactinopolyspora halotolerans]NED99384.1 hypothetical protein [Phytoactinopolyspora halotolerans]
MAQYSVRRYVMCPPAHFAVEYAINPWMDTSRPVHRGRAVAQWERLRETYEALGHQVDLLEPIPGLPDMVFTANGAMVIGDRALGARFRESVREPEAPAHREFLTGLGIDVRLPQAVNEGQGDFAWTGRHILAGSGFRTSREAHVEVEQTFGVPVLALELVDPRFYHLDTALCVLDSDVIAYYPPAFSEASRRILAEGYPDAILAGDDDAQVLGLNAVSDGEHVVLAAQAEKLCARIAEAGFTPIPVDVSELLRGGGGAKCATLELHDHNRPRAHTAGPRAGAGQ